MSEIPETLTVNGIDYIRADSPQNGDIKIVVLDRGYIYIGKTKIENDFIVITYAKNIRRWGTTKGLGQLVNGPLAETELDQVGTVRSPLRALISLIDVDQSKWNYI